MRRKRSLLNFDEFSLGLAIAVIFAVLAIVVEKDLVDLPFLKIIELKILDKKFAIGESKPKGDDIVIVGIDEKSLSRFKRWPLEGHVYAKLTEELQKLGAKVIAFDIIFYAEIDNIVSNAFEILKENVSPKKVCRDEEFSKAVSEVEGSFFGDRHFASVLSPAENIVHIYKFLRQFEDVEETRVFAVGSKLKGDTINFSGDPKGLKIKEAIDFRQSSPTILGTVKHAGYMNIDLDWDGVCRTIPLVYRYGDEVYKAFSMVVLERYLSKSFAPGILRYDGYEGLRLEIAGVDVPVDEDGSFRINYYGPKGSFKYLSIVDVIDGKVSKEAVKGKIVLVGSTAPILHDLKTTPFDPLTPGIEVHATVISNILDRNFISRGDPWLVGFEILLIVLFGMIMGIALRHLTLLAGFPVMLVLIAGYIFMDIYLVFPKGKLLQVIVPVLEVVALYICIGIFKYKVIESKGKEIKSRFKHYVADAVVEEMMQREDLNLGMVRKHLTVLFSDIRGFSNISEKLEPAVLERLLNRHMTVLTEEIVKNGGTIDKYMGDSVMAIFGAPLDLPDHAFCACKAAFSMIKAIRTFNAKLEGDGYPPFNVGIGISTGEVLVGNMGSEQLFSYSVLGTNVNVAARIEELNKEFSTSIIISEPTLERTRRQGHCPKLRNGQGQGDG